MSDTAPSQDQLADRLDRDVSCIKMSVTQLASTITDGWTSVLRMIAEDIEKVSASLRSDLARAESADDLLIVAAALEEQRVDNTRLTQELEQLRTQLRSVEAMRNYHRHRVGNVLVGLDRVRKLLRDDDPARHPTSAQVVRIIVEALRPSDQPADARTSAT